ncbi:hypothetical protein Pfo_007120 [Paulownia fortunei]|nr:hypothetical protein Pfo_007120 [Paulownia fortunei]
MKSIDLFCASPASTAICSSMDHRAIVRHGMRSIDRQIHHLGDTPRSRTNAAPCSSQLPIDPSRPFYHKGRKTTAKQTEILRRKSSADVDDLASSPSSSRYLLSDKPFLDVVSDSERALISSQPLIRDNNYKRLNLDGCPAFRSLSTRSHEYPVYKPSSNSAQAQKNPSGKLSDHLNAQKSSSPPSNRQVVELRVSIHCKGCEGKLRKYISRMEGKYTRVTSFSIDLETKKVTVIGDVTPLGVLTSISKVKNAQFWPSPTSSSSSSSSPRVTLTR